MSDNQSVQLLAFIWRQLVVDAKEIATTDGVIVKLAETYKSEVLADGSVVLYAKLLKGIEYRTGTILFLARTSLWYSPKYITQDIKNGTILVVTCCADQDVIDSSFSNIDTVYLPIPSGVLEVYNKLQSQGNILCRKYISRIPKITKMSIMERFIVERLDDKANKIMKSFNRLGRNWDDTFVYALFDAIAIGNKVNRRLFCNLADIIRYAHILNELSTVEQKEAVIFGVAGLLESVVGVDDYTAMLRKEFVMINRYYRLNKINALSWDYRSQNPNASVHALCAYLTYMMHNMRDLMNTILGHYDLNDLRLILQADMTPYWHYHTSLGSAELSSKLSRKMSESKRDLLIVNFAVPMLYAYYREENPDNCSAIIEKLLDDYLPNTKAERNSIISTWTTREYTPLDSFDAQALIQASKVYCSKKRCVECHIGKVLLRGAYKGGC